MTAPLKEKRASRRSVTHADRPDPLATAPTPDQQHQSLVGLIAAHGLATARLAALQGRADELLHQVLESIRAPHAEQQAQVARLAVEIEAQARAHPEWFGDARQLKTPFGTVKFTAATRLAVDNEPATILALDAMHGEQETPNPFLRQIVEINLDALAGLPTEVLDPLGVRRVREDKFTLKPARVDLGKTAVASAVQTPGKEVAR